MAVAIKQLPLLLTLLQNCLFLILFNQKPEKDRSNKNCFEHIWQQLLYIYSLDGPKRMFCLISVFPSSAIVNFVCKIDIRVWLTLIGASRKLLKFRGTLNPSLSRVCIHNTCTSIFNVKLYHNTTLTLIGQD